ncbi:MAG: S1 RNA-binding domain-containing protein [Muribaculaceae bacterium]|nr:S1 RNA-binding domain-containing protein [Muribaculaceae bacterium]
MEENTTVNAAAEEITEEEITKEEIGTTETMADYSRELEASFRTIHEGDIMSGTVIDVAEDGVILDLGYYTSGIIKTADISKDPAFSIMADVHVGDTIEAMVVRKDDGEGNIQLSCVGAVDVLGWDRLQEYLNEKKVIKAKVSEVVNKGVVVYVEGIRGFIPASQLALEYVGDLDSFMGKTLELYVITVDKDKQRLVLSAKELLKEKEADRINHKISMIVPGSILEGRVESLMPYGAFVDLGDGLSGLVHISQISMKRIRKPSEVLKVGDSVKVKVLNTNDNKISLSIKAVEDFREVDDIEEKQAEEYSSKESVGTSLGDLLKGLELNNKIQEVSE